MRTVPISAAEQALGIPESRWVDVGGPVHYREWEGPPDGPVSVLVHGLGGSLLNWALVAPGLARRGRVLALDLAGFGRTPRDGRVAGIGPSRRLLSGFIDRMDLGSVDLVGNSMGGVVALAQAAHEPASVRSLVLADAAFPPPGASLLTVPPSVAVGFLAAATRRAGPAILQQRARRLGPEALVWGTLEYCTGDPASIDPRLVVATIEAVAQHGDDREVAEAFAEASRSIVRAFLFPRRYRALVRAIRTPALVVHGAADPLVPVRNAWNAVRFHSNWSMVVMPGVGHLPMMEAPARFLDLALGWLADTGQNDRG